MKEAALIIFVRNPELGKVKTRLAATIGKHAALDIYKKLLLHTHTIASAVACDRYVFYAGDIPAVDIWSGPLFIRQPQCDGDLGDRMLAAFDDLLKRYKRAVIIGSDCIKLTAEIIQQAIGSLNDNEVVIGPSEDGGYYLLGMRNFYAGLFNNINWSTGTVFTETTSVIEEMHLSYKTLQVLPDIDTEEDWIKYGN